MTGITFPKRNPKRSSLFLRGRLRGKSDTQDVRIRDVSTEGARLDINHTEPLNEIVTLNCGRISVQGRVAWTEGGSMGIAFAEPLSDEVLVDALKQRMRVAAPRQYRDGRIINGDIYEQAPPLKH